MLGAGKAETPIDSENESIVSLGSPPFSGRREDAPRDGQPGVDVGVRQQDRELVASDAEGAVAPPENRGGDPPDGLEQSVAPDVALRVVDSLEVVDVDEQQRQRRPHPLGEVELARELILERPVVAEAREAVDQRFVARLAVKLAAAPRVRGRGPRLRAGSRARARP